MDAFGSIPKYAAVVSAASTFLGTLLLVAYFARIGYVPPIGVADLTLLLFTFAWTGFLLLLASSLGPLATGVLWREFVMTNDSRPFRISRRIPRGYGATSAARNTKVWRARHRRIATLLLAPTLVGFALLVAPWERGSFTAGLIFSALSLLATAALVRTQGADFSSALGYVVTLGSSIFLMMLTLSLWNIVLLDAFVSPEYGPGVRIALYLVVVFVALILSATFVSPMMQGSSCTGSAQRLVPIACGISVMTLTAWALVPQSDGGLGARMLRTAAAGAMKNTTLILEEDADAVMRAHGLHCRSTERDADDCCIVDGVDVLWARGDEYVLHLPTRDAGEHDTDSEPDGSRMRVVTLSRDDVISMSISSALRDR